MKLQNIKLKLLYLPYTYHLNEVFTQYFLLMEKVLFSKNLRKVPLKSEGIEISGLPIRRLLLRTHEGDKFVRYFET